MKKKSHLLLNKDANDSNGKFHWQEKKKKPFRKCTTKEGSNPGQKGESGIPNHWVILMLL